MATQAAVWLCPSHPPLPILTSIRSQKNFVHVTLLLQYAVRRSIHLHTHLAICPLLHILKLYPPRNPPAPPSTIFIFILIPHVGIYNAQPARHARLPMLPRTLFLLVACSQSGLRLLRVIQQPFAFDVQHVRHHKHPHGGEASSDTDGEG